MEMVNQVILILDLDFQFSYHAEHLPMMCLQRPEVVVSMQWRLLPLNNELLSQHKVHIHNMDKFIYILDVK